MIQLTATISRSLVECIRAGKAPIDAVEMVSSISIGEIMEYQRALPDWTFHFHAGRLGLMPFTRQRLLSYQRTCPQAPWVSLHIALVPPPIILLALRRGVFLPFPYSPRHAPRLIKKINSLKSALQIPIILENMPSSLTRKYAYENTPELITEVLEATDSRLLLDIGHARSAAKAHRMDEIDYLARLPLERVAQIHVSGPRQRGEFIYDAHEAMLERDYELLEWVLERSTPRVVTLEYFRDREELSEQLNRLREMLPV